MEKRIPASVRLEHTIADLVEDGNWEPESLAELGRLGAQLMIQRAVEDEVREFLGRAHYERNPDGRGWRNGVRPRRVQKWRSVMNQKKLRTLAASSPAYSLSRRGERRKEAPKE